MNAERDVQRLVTHWLAEEAEVRAPDRVLHSARRTIDRTRQRRLVVAWREPMYVSPFRLATAAAVVVVALVGAAFLGRMTALPGAGGAPTPSTAPAPTTDATAAFAAYSSARNEICTRYDAETQPLRSQFDNLYDPSETAAERAPKIAALAAFGSAYHEMVTELAALEAPAEIVADHAADVARFDAVAGMIDGIVTRLNTGDLAGAESLDQATDPMTADTEQFESRKSLTACP